VPVVDNDATATEVDDMESSLCTPATGRAPIAEWLRVVAPPMLGGYATGVPFAGHRSTDLPGLPARAAPV
jgi:hypothetical protein